MEYVLNYKEIRDIYYRINYLHYIFQQIYFYGIRNEIQEQLYKLFVNRNKTYHGDIIVFFEYEGNVKEFRFMANFPKNGKAYFIYHQIRLDKSIKIYFNCDKQVPNLLYLLDNLYKSDGINNFVGNFIVTKYNNNEISDYKIFNHMSKLELILYYKDILRNINYTNNFKRIIWDYNIENKTITKITSRFSDLSLIERLFIFTTNKYDQDDNIFIKISLNNGITIKLWPDIKDDSENNIKIRLKDEFSINK